MPVSSLLNGSIVEIKAEGRYTLADLLEAITSAYKEDGAPAFPRLLIDARASRVRQSKQDVQERLTAIDRWRCPRPAKRVALVESPGRNHELAHFYSFYAQQRGTETEVFLDPAAARRWLLTPDHPSPPADQSKSASADWSPRARRRQPGRSEAEGDGTPAIKSR